MDNLIFYTEEYPPYNYYDESSGIVNGIFVDILEYILLDNSYKLVKKDINYLTWARAYNLTLQKENSVVFAITRSEERENLFKWVGPVINTKIVLTAKKSRKLKINNIKEIENFKVGLIKDGIAIQTLSNFNINQDNFDIGQSQKANAKKLAVGRIDIWAYEERVARDILKSINEDLADYESLFTIKEGYLYFGFNKNTSDEILTSFQNSLNKLQNEDIYQLNKILNKYE
jgi:ABC-type amino acid transport substrate-binding protein